MRQIVGKIVLERPVEKIGHMTETEWIDGRGQLRDECVSYLLKSNDQTDIISRLSSELFADSWKTVSLV